MIRPTLNPSQWLAPKMSVPGSGNQVCELRFSLDSVPNSVTIKACAYPNYAVYLNGEYVGSDEFSYVTEYEISSKLQAGENVLRVFILPNLSDGWISVECDEIPISTRNPDWKWLQDDPLMHREIPFCIRGGVDAPWDGAGQQFSEVPTKPYRPTGVVNLPSHGATVMFPKGSDIIAYSEGDRVPFEHEIVFDFGAETLGYLEAEVEASDECSLTLAYAESFNCLDVDPWWHRHDTFKLRKGRNRIHDPSRKGFRYVRLTVDCGCRVTVLDTINHRPGRELKNRGYFKCSDEFLNRVNDVSCYTVELCNQKFLEDGVKRDRLCWTGDLRPMALVMYNQLGDTDIVRDSLYVFARHTNEHGVIQPAYPWRTGWVMTDYVMWWIISLWEYFEHTGDIETLRELAPIAFEQEKWLRSKCDERGLIITKAEGDAPITCWSSRSRDGYTAYHNALWCKTKNDLMYMRWELEPGAQEREIQKRLQTAKSGKRPDYGLGNLLRETFADSSGLWRDLDFDGNFRPEIPHDGTVTAMLSHIPSAIMYPVEIGGEWQVERSLDALKSGWTQFGAPLWWPSGEGEPAETNNRIMPVYNAYEVEQRMDHGDWNGAVDLLKRCYGHMLDVGSTTFWEAMQWNGSPDSVGKEGFVSLCHGWSGYPAAFLPRLLGSNFNRPNDHITLMPYHPSDSLKYVEASIPVGDEQMYLNSEWDAGARVWRYSGRLPECITDGSIFSGMDSNSVEVLQCSGCSQDIPEYADGEYFPLGFGDLKPGENFEVTIKCKESYQPSR